MTSAFLTAPKAVPSDLGIIGASRAAGRESQLIDDRLKGMRLLLSGGGSSIASMPETKLEGRSLHDQLALRAASLKRMIAVVAMHLDAQWRQELLATIDRLLDPDDWDEDIRLPGEPSFATFLRMIIYLHPTRRPGLGLSPQGFFLAAWTKGEDRIVIECRGKDEVRWVLSRVTETGRESGAGKVPLHRVPDVTAPFDPEPLFCNGHSLLA